MQYACMVVIIVGDWLDSEDVSLLLNIFLMAALTVIVHMVSSFCFGPGSKRKLKRLSPNANRIDFVGDVLPERSLLRSP